MQATIAKVPKKYQEIVQKFRALPVAQQREILRKVQLLITSSQ
jgi:hypothetical protein